MDRFARPTLPKGRGFWFSDIADSRAVGHSKYTPDGWAETGLGQSPGFIPVIGLMREGPLASTSYSGVDAIHRLPDIVGQLGAWIDESIVAKLMSVGVVNMNNDHQTTSTTQNSQCDINRHDLTHVTVHVKPDKVLQTFGSDNTDKYSVQD